MCTFWKPKGFRQRLAGMKVKSGVSTICWLECCITGLFRKKYARNVVRFNCLTYILQSKKQHKETSIRELEKDDFDWFSDGEFDFFSTQTRLYELFYVMIKVFIYIVDWQINMHAMLPIYVP